MSPNETPNSDQPPAPQVVHIARPLEPQQVEISPEVKRRHDESKQKYPYLNLSNGEYVISAVRRHPFGLTVIWGVTGLIIAILVTFITLLLASSSDATSSLNATAGNSLPLLVIPLVLAAVMVFIGGAIGTFIFQANAFYLTNESVIQHIQHGLFSKRKQTVSLGNIEDASFIQSGVVSHIFNYGSLRLSTEGDETTYRFNYASKPEQQIAILNNAVEAFKHGRPVEG